NTKQITMFMEDCKNMGVDVLGPDVNESQYEFSVNDKGQIRFGLGAIKGIGEGPSEAIVITRKEQSYSDIYDFFQRIPSSQINKRVAESLVMAGAFDEVDKYHRAQYFDIDNNGKTNLERLLRYGQSFQDSRNEIENSLFADFAEEVRIEPPKINPAPEWPNMYLLNKEKEIIGFYLSAHPLDEFKYQYRFIQGALGRNSILDGRPEEGLPTLDPVIIPVEVGDEEGDEVVDLIIDDGDEIVEEEQKNVEAKGNFNFLNLDEIDAFRDKVFGPDQIRLFEEIQDYREKQKFNNNSKEYMVTGLITEYTDRDGL